MRGSSFHSHNGTHTGPQGARRIKAAARGLRDAIASAGVKRGAGRDVKAEAAKRARSLLRSRRRDDAWRRFNAWAERRPASTIILGLIAALVAAIATGMLGPRYED